MLGPRLPSSGLVVFEHPDKTSASALTCRMEATRCQEFVARMSFITVRPRPRPPTTITWFYPSLVIKAAVEQDTFGVNLVIYHGLHSYYQGVRISGQKNDSFQRGRTIELSGNSLRPPCFSEIEYAGTESIYQETRGPSYSYYF